MLFLLLVLAFLLLLFIQVVEAEELVVDEKGTGDYTELRSAVGGASPGDVIIVKPGNYSYVLSINSPDDLTIKGEDRENCRVWHSSYASFYVGVKNLQVSGLNLTGGDEGENCGVVFSRGAENSTIVNCSIYNMSRGVCIYSETWGITVENCSLWNTGLTFWTNPEQGLEQASSFSYQNNSINGKSLVFLKGERSRTLTGKAGGLILVDCENITIENQTLGESYNGIAIYNSRNIVIRNCNISSPWQGISIFSSQGITVVNCMVSKPESVPFGYLGNIYSQDSSGLIITSNSLHGAGILMNTGKGNHMGNNTITGSTGILLSYTGEATITDNHMESGGIYFYMEGWVEPHRWKYYDHIILGNTVGGKPVLYLKNETGQIISGEELGQLILVGCDNATVTGLETQQVCYFYDCDGVQIHNSSVGDETFENGLRIIRSRKCWVENSTVRSFAGLEIIESLDCLVTGCYGSPVSLVDSHNSRIIMNNLSGLDRTAIFLRNANNTLIEGNVILNNSYNGISASNLRDLRILGNNISGNHEGIRLGGTCHNISIHYNNIMDNSEFGLEVTDPDNCTLDASKNWWGHPTGPKGEWNPGGKGNSVSGTQEFRPWLKEPVVGYPPEESSEESGSLLAFLVVAALVAVVFALALHYFQVPLEEGITQNKVSAPEVQDQVFQCSHCQGSFSLPKGKRPPEFNCHFCGKKIEPS